jgi:AraC-like DNA-binding protein
MRIAGDMSETALASPGSSTAGEWFRPGPVRTPEATCLSFSSEELPARDRIAIWREVFARAIMRIDWTPTGEEPFHCQARLCRLPGLGMISCMKPSGAFSRSRAMAADGNDDLLVGISHTGKRLVSHLGREPLVDSGHAVLMMANEPARWMAPTAARGICIAIPSRALMPMIADRDAAIARVIPHGTPGLHLLASYVELLLQGHMLTDPALQGRAVSHVYDLVALAIGATRDAAETARGRGLRAARRADLYARAGRLIVLRFDDPDLVPEEIARQLGVSLRLLQQVFAERGETVMSRLWDERVHRAALLLSGPEAADRSITDIAFGCGFNDGSHFGRVFAAHKGIAPSQWRKQALERIGDFR